MQCSVIELESSQIQLKSSLIRPTSMQYVKMLALQSYHIQLQSSVIELRALQLKDKFK